MAVKSSSRPPPPISLSAGTLLHLHTPHSVARGCSVQISQFGVFQWPGSVLAAPDCLHSLPPLVPGRAQEPGTHYCTAAQSYFFSIELQHNGTTVLQHNVNITQLNCKTISLLHYRTTAQYNYYTTAQCHFYTIAQFHYYTTAQCHYYTTSLQPIVTTSLQQCATM